MHDKNKEFRTVPSLVGQKVFLRPATADDVANFHHWFTLSEPQTQSCRPISLRSAAEATEAFKKNVGESPVKQFAIVRQKDKTPVGKISYFDYNPLNRSAELGILIDPDEHKKGHAKDALQVLIKYLFLRNGLNKVYAQTAEFNKGAIKLFESLRFEKDAALRSHYFHEGEFQDGLIYSFLRYQLDW